jgi:hypothetical protein
MEGEIRLDEHVLGLRKTSFLEVSMKSVVDVLLICFLATAGDDSVPIVLVSDLEYRLIGCAWFSVETSGI